MSNDTLLLRRASRRLGLQAALLVTLIVVVLSAVAVLIVVQAQHRVDTTLLREAAVRADDVTDPPSGVWLILRHRDGSVVSTPGTPAGLPDRAVLDRVAKTGVPSTSDLHAGGVEYRIYTIRQRDRTVQAALDTTSDHRVRKELATALLVTGGLGLVLAAVTGAWLGRRAVRPLASALALQRRFVADAGHELRTPLTLLSTRIQLLHRHLRGAGAGVGLTEEAAGAVADARHLAAIVDDLLLAAAPGDDGPSGPVDLTELAEAAVAAYANAVESPSVTLDVPATPVRVPGGATGLRRAVTALLDNAVRHARSAVTVTVRVHGGRAVLDVVDDGPGIDPDLLPRVFDRFATAREDELPAGPPQERPPVPRRYGLGLALVSEIAARHSGDVTAANVPDGGARLRLTLPLADS